MISYYVLNTKESVQRLEVTKINNRLIFSVVWYTGFMLVSWVSSAKGINIINEFTHWFTLVIFPILGLKLVSNSSIREIIGGVGFIKQTSKECIRKSFLICLLMTPLYVVSLTLYYEIPVTVFIENPINLLINFAINMCVYFVANIFTAGLTEEVFFRGIIQNNINKKMNSFFVPIILTSLLFGLYHFPYAYFMWEGTQGNVMGSLIAVLTEQAIAGFFLGIVYAQSRNILTSVIVHAYSNALVMFFLNYLVNNF